MPASTLYLIDENSGRNVALRHGLKVTGAVGILEKAAERGLLDFRAALQRLEETNFRLSPSIQSQFLKRNL